MEQVSKPNISKPYFWKSALLCVYIFEPQIYILLFNKLVSYKVLIDYKNLHAGFSDSVAWATLCALSYDPVLEYPWAINTFL